MEKKEKAPVLRFKDTNGKDYPAWEQRKFFEIIEKVIDFRGRTPKKLGLDWSSEGYLALSALNVKDSYIDFDQDPHYGDDRLYKKWMTGKELHKGQVLFTTEAPMGNVAQVPDEKKYILSQRVIAFQCKEQITNDDFLAVLLKSDSVTKTLNKLTSGGTAQGVSQKSLQSLVVSLPVDIGEQKRISETILALEGTITLHQRKLEALKKLKRTLLQKMFPKKGHLKPELRFFGFTNDWEQRKLGDIGTVQMNKRIFKTQTSTSGEIPFYKIGTFGKIPDAYISRELFEEYKKKYPYPKKGDLLLSASGSIGNVVEYNGEEAYFQDSNIVWLEHGKTISNFFLKAFYSVVNWEGIEGTTIKRLYNKTILDTPITLPSFEEQEKIGNFFTVLDKVITLHQRKLEIYKKLKKGLLQKMFI